MRFKVKIGPITSSLPSMLSLTSTSSPGSTSSPEKDLPAQQPQVQDEVMLSWHQKLFSKAEFRQYANAKEDDFDAPMKKKLVCDAKKLMSEGFVPKNR